jgi:glutamine amidotransferase
MRKLEKLNLVDEIRYQISEKKKPFLGICVGMQLLASLGTEFEEYAGIGAIPGIVQKMNTKDEGLILPHMGWNTVHPTRTSLLFHDMTPSPIFYFVHSYHFVPTSSQVVLAQCNYGNDFVAVIQHENIFGVQFHPEKSQHHGLQLLKNFAAVEARKSA